MEEPIDERYAAAVAAAAFAVSSKSQQRKNQPEEIQRKKSYSEGSQPTKAHVDLNKPKSRKENTVDPGMISKWFSIKEDKEGRDSAGVDRPKLKKAPTFTGEKGKKISDTTKSTAPRRGETPADAWERAEMAKIRKRHEKANDTILQWEKEKKQKLRRKLEHKEGQLDMRRKVLLQDHREEVTRIEKISKGARMSAEEKKRYEERKAMEKANQIRSTGKVPSNCFWF